MAEVTAITSKKRNSYPLAAARQQMIDAVGGDDVEVPMPDGTIVHFPHPLFQPKEIKKALKAFYKRPPEEQDSDDLAEILLGDDYESFVEHDGDADDLQFVIMQVQRDATKAINGTPTRS